MVLGGRLGCAWRTRSSGGGRAPQMLLCLTHMVLRRAPRIRLASEPPFHCYGDFLIIFAPVHYLLQCPEVSCCRHAGFNWESLLRLPSIPCSQFKCYRLNRLSKFRPLQSVILNGARATAFLYSALILNHEVSQGDVLFVILQS